MSVWVEGMQLPKECYECPFSYVNSYAQRICSRLERECCDQFYCGDNGRLEDCPIRELPSSHGDLIDKDQLINGMVHDWDIARQDYSNDLIISEEDLQELPIIIPFE